MRKPFIALLMACMAFSVSAQDNMEAFRHLSVGAEAGLHGFGVEVAMPIQKHIVLKAGYNWTPSLDLRTNVTLDTKDLKQAQEDYENSPVSGGYKFQHRFEDEAVIDAGLQLGLTNYKAMINWYPFASGRFYLAGGVYYTPDKNKEEPFISLSGQTTENDWAALNELNSRLPEDQQKEMKIDIAGEPYPIIEKDGCGYMQADFKMDPLKYYVGMGLGRCVPNKFMGLQLEVGAMIYHNSVLYCQDKEVGSILDAADGLGNDAKEILEYVDKYPIYPQVTLRLSFRLF